MIKIKVIFIVLLLSFLVLSSESSSHGTRGDYGVKIECQDNEQTTIRFVDACYQITIKNTGNMSDTYNITKDSTPKYWKANLSISQISIPSNEIRNITLKVKPTCSCEEGDNISLNVTVTSQNYSSVFDKMETITTFSKGSLSISTLNSSAYIYQGDSYTFKIEINSSRPEDDLLFLQRFYPSDIFADFGDNYLSQKKGTIGVANLTVYTDDTTHIGSYQVNITISSVYEPEIEDNLTLTIIVMKSKVINGSEHIDQDGESNQIVINLIISFIILISTIILVVIIYKGKKGK